MEGNQLLGRKVHARGSDLAGTSIAAVVRAIDPASNSLLLEFQSPMQIGARAYQFAVARPRLQRDHLITLLRSGSVGCAITLVPPDRYNAADPFDLTWWRGGDAAIADLVLAA